jgi:hypothetical protein
MFSMILYVLFVIVSSQSVNAYTQFEFYYLNKPRWESTIYLVENVFDDNKLYKWIEKNDTERIALLPTGVNEGSIFVEPGEWGEGVVTFAIDRDLDIGAPLRMCMYGSGENFSYQDERCEYSSVSKLRIAMVQMDLSPD